MTQQDELAYLRAWTNRWARRLNVSTSTLRKEFGRHPGDPREDLNAVRKNTRSSPERPSAH